MRGQMAIIVPSERYGHEPGILLEFMDSIVAAGEVERADHVADERAVAAPHHVGERRVDDDHPQGQERAHRAELHAPGH